MAVSATIEDNEAEFEEADEHATLALCDLLEEADAGRMTLRAGAPPPRADRDGARAHRRPRPSRERATGVRAVCKRPQPSTREPSRSAARPCRPTSTDGSSGSDSTTGRSCGQRTVWPSCD